MHLLSISTQPAAAVVTAGPNSAEVLPTASWPQNSKLLIFHVQATEIVSVHFVTFSDYIFLENFTLALNFMLSRCIIIT